jgi:hypothetical protein
MPDLLLIGGAPIKSLERMADKFTIHKLADGGYPADKITHVCTNGHDGIKPDIMASSTSRATAWVTTLSTQPKP